MSRGTAHKRWLIRMDHEITKDVDFNDRCDRSARMAYIDCLFFLASGDGPDGIYPYAEVAAELGDDTESVVTQLSALGVWEDLGLGYHVHPYCGWCVVPEKRAPIPPEVRAAVYERDGYCCCTCGTTEDLTLDHIHPWSLGGSDEPFNLRTLCRRHNSSKGARI